MFSNEDDGCCEVLGAGDNREDRYLSAVHRLISFLSVRSYLPDSPPNALRHEDTLALYRDRPSQLTTSQPSNTIQLPSFYQLLPVKKKQMLHSRFRRKRKYSATKCVLLQTRDSSSTGEVTNVLKCEEVCPMCDLKEVEDIEDFLLSCPMYYDRRSHCA